MTFRIERIRKCQVGHKPAPGRSHNFYEHSSNGFLITGYDDGSDWLVSPLGRHTWGGIFRECPTKAWAISADRRDYHRLHLYILDIPAKSCVEAEGLSLNRNHDVVDYDGEQLVLICAPTADVGDVVRELVIVDIASAQVTDRFVLKGYTHLFQRAMGRTSDGWLVLDVSLLGEDNERLYKHGIARIHPLTREIALELFAREGFPVVTISPSGRHVLKIGKGARHPEFTAIDGIGSIGLWAINPVRHIRDLPLEWAGDSLVWRFPANPELLWQPGEAAFWWPGYKQVICLGLDGSASRPVHLDAPGSTGSALPGRIAEFTFERETNFETYRLDGSPSGDLSPVDAPASVIVTPDAAGEKRQRNAQAALTKIVKAKSNLKFALKTADAEELIGALDAITAALDRGLGWYADDEGIIRLSVKIAGTAYNEKQFFGLVEKLGSAAVPALVRLLAKCCLDADLRRVWSGNLEDGQQAFGIAAKALAGIDVDAWIQLAEYEMCIDDGHELYFRRQAIPHFIKYHGWREESFALALADIVQMRGNLGDNFLYYWRRSGLAAAAEAAYTPGAFAEFMLGIRNRMLSSPVGTFANFVARVSQRRPSAHGWYNYDRLFDQIKDNLTPWETRLFAELQIRASAGGDTDAADNIR